MSTPDSALQIDQILPTLEDQLVRWKVEINYGTADLGSIEAATMRDLSWRLADAEMMDVDTIAAPGAGVVLPWGTALLTQLRRTIEAAYTAHGYEMYDFPDVGPPDLYAPALARFPAQQQLLYVADTDELSRGSARGVLSPAGEAMVYRFWSRRVRSHRDLPIRLYRNARYYRPVPTGGGRSGRGVLRPLEARDVLEFHAAVDGDHAARAELDRVTVMLRSIIDAWHVPVLLSMRPPWTNNGELYRAAYGADTLLPTGDSVQVAAYYDQGSAFAEAYDIRMRDVRPHRHPLHITGCVTRRLLLAHVFQSVSADGQLVLHPDVLPAQAVLRSVDAEAVAPLAAALTAAGVRVETEIVRSRQLASAASRWRRRGVAVQVLVQPPRHGTDHVRVVVSGPNDDDKEVLAPGPEGAEAAASTVIKTIEEVRAQHQASAVQRLATGLRRADRRQIADVVTAGGIAVAGLAPTCDAVRAVESECPGEVLGLVPAATPTTCVVTGASVDSYALVGGRA